MAIDIKGLYYLNNEYDTETRFDLTKFMRYTDNQDPITSDFLRRLPKLTAAGSYVVTNDEKRPDLISFRIYGDTQYWWIILMYNKLTEFTDLAVGDKLTYPSLQDLEDLLFDVGSKSRAQ